MSSNKFLLVVGTRPEVIKMRPVFDALVAQGDDPWWCVTSQSIDLLKDFNFEHARTFYARFAVENYRTPLVGLHSEITRAMIYDVPLEPAYWKAFVVHGDTQTAVSVAMVAALAKIPVAHVEAGLRSRAALPFPEEMNRRLIAQMASLHLAPTELDRIHLREESVASQAIVVTGQTGIDALHAALKPNACGTQPRIVVTCHRRENRDRIAQLIAALTPLLPDHHVIWPRHPNYGPSTNTGPEVIAEAAFPFVTPMSHDKLVGELQIADLIITDSGGVIEEAAELERPCLIIRNETERPAAIDQGCTLVLRESMGGLRHLIEEKLDWGRKWKRSSKGLFGDGKAALRVATALREMKTSTPG